MNKVIFIYFLTVSLCYSLPSEPQGKAAQPVASDVKPGAPHAAEPTVPVTTTAVTKALEPHPDHTDNKTSPADHKATTQVVPITSSAPITPDPITNTTVTDSNVVKPTNTTIPENKTGKKSEKIPVKPAANDPKPATTDKGFTSTTPVTPLHNTNTTTTVAPKTNDKHKELKSRSFDAASFFGGIMLALGMLGIGYIGLKYYRSQAERNYHTL